MPQALIQTYQRRMWVEIKYGLKLIICHPWRRPFECRGQQPPNKMKSCREKCFCAHHTIWQIYRPLILASMCRWRQDLMCKKLWRLFSRSTVQETQWREHSIRPSLALWRTRSILRRGRWIQSRLQMSTRTSRYQSTRTTPQKDSIKTPQRTSWAIDIRPNQPALGTVAKRSWRQAVRKTPKIRSRSYSRRRSLLTGLQLIPCIAARSAQQT